MKNNGIKKVISIVLSFFVFSLCVLSPVKTTAASDGRVLVPEECTDTVTVWEYPDGTREAEIIIPAGLETTTDNTGAPERLEASSENSYGLENTGDVTETLVNADLNKNEAVAVVEKENKSMRFTPVIPDMLPAELPEETSPDELNTEQSSDTIINSIQTADPVSTPIPQSTEMPTDTSDPSPLPSDTFEPTSVSSPEPAEITTEEEIEDAIEIKSEITAEPEIYAAPEITEEQLSSVLAQTEALKSISLPVKVFRLINLHEQDIETGETQESAPENAETYETDQTLISENNNQQNNESNADDQPSKENSDVQSASIHDEVEIQPAPSPTPQPEQPSQTEPENINSEEQTTETAAEPSASPSLQPNLEAPELTTEKIGYDGSTYEGVKYENVFADGIDVIIRPVVGGIKEDVVFRKYIGVNSYSYIADFTGMTPEQDGNRIVLKDSNGLKTAEIAAPYVTDASGSVSYDVSLILQQTGTESQYYLTYTVPNEWLSDPARTFPVTVDPTATYDSGTNSNPAFEDNIAISTQNYGDVYPAEAEGYAIGTTGDTAYRAFVRAALPDDMKGSTILDFKWHIYVTNR